LNINKLIGYIDQRMIEDDTWHKYARLDDKPYWEGSLAAYRDLLAYLKEQGEN
jgi:hypothetical protein